MVFNQSVAGESSSCLLGSFVCLFMSLVIYLAFVVEDVIFAGKSENVFYAKIYILV